ncbi:MAG: type II toxin-antitoxin system VapC family toxin [Thermofilaceae archaeon]
MKLIDTSWLVELLRRKSFEEGAISLITLIEVLRGVPAGKREIVKKLLEESFDVLGIDNSVVRIYCELYDELKKRGSLVPDADLLIASTAIAHNLVLRTKDRHFKELVSHGLKLELVE